MTSEATGEGKGITAEELQFIWNDIANEIIEERKYQDKRHAFPYNMMMAILTEKVGKVAYAYQESRDEYLRDTLIQTAAVCIRWIEHLKKDVHAIKLARDTDGVMDIEEQQ